jgi:hypothetical protein
MLALRAWNIPLTLKVDKKITSFIGVPAAGNGIFFVTKHMNSFILTVIVKMRYFVVFKYVFLF